MAISESHILVGAPGDDFACDEYYSDPVSCSALIVHAYELEHGAWQSAGTFTPHSNPTAFNFGRSVAVDGSTAIVGASFEVIEGVPSGAVYIFNLEEFCPGDPTDDGVINELDRALLCSAMGSSAGDQQFNPAVDFNADNIIDHLDLAHFNALATGICITDLAHTADFQLPGDHVIDGVDLAILLGDWGEAPSCADLVSSTSFAPAPDGIVDGADLAFLLDEWGGCE